MVECISIRDSGTGSTARVLAGFGFNCYSFKARDAHGEVELLWAEEGFETGAKRPSGSGIPLLFPFPGRLPGMTLTWEGESYPLESDDGRGNGIHGFVHKRPWRVIDQSESSVRGQFQASADDPQLLNHWPADFHIEAGYRLEDNTLISDLRISNPDDKPLPCGLGSHPYFRIPLGSGGDDCRIHLPVAGEWRLEDMLPTGERIKADAELSSGAQFANLKLDNVFTELQFADGWFRSSIEDKSNERRLEVAFDDGFSECVVYTPPHREAICIEPYTCVPGAAGRTDFETGWRVLEPGETASFEIRISLVS